jgi:hypothetical protein
VISRDTKKLLARTAKETYFPHRHYPEIIEQALSKAGHLSGEVRAFQDYISSNRKSIKEKDAIMLVRHFKELAKG